VLHHHLFVSQGHCRSRDNYRGDDLGVYHASSIADILAAQSTTALTFAARFEPIAISLLAAANGEVN